jgi:hypothetical protein
MASGGSEQAPSIGVQMEFQPEYTAFPARETVKLTFGAHITAPAMEEDSTRSVVSLSAVLDKSGSMSGNKIDLVKKSQEFMMAQLSAKDKLGVVQYDSDVDELLKLARTSEAFKREAQIAVKNITPGTCTNLSGGLFLGVAQQQKNTYIDYDQSDGAGPGGPPSAGGAGSPNSLQPSEHPASHNPNSPRSVATSDFTDVGSETSEYVDVPLAVQMPEIDLPEAAVEEEEQEDDSCDLQQQVQSNSLDLQQQMQQMQTNAHPFVQTNITSPAPRRNMMQRVAQMFRPRRGPTPQAAPVVKGRRGEIASLLKDGKAPKDLQLEEDAVRSVFLFTDGLANEGIQDANQLVNMLQRMLDKSPRVRVYTFGYGSDHSPDLLQRIAAAGSGTYYFIKNEESIPTAFADALGGLLSVAAQNVSVEFEPAPGVNISEVHTSYRTTEGPNGSRTISVGDLFSEESKDILFDVELPALSAPVEDYTVGTLRISYLDVAGACMRSEELRCVVRRLDAVPEGLAPAVNVTMQKARIMTAKTLAEAKEEADAGRYEEARSRVQGSINMMQAVQEQAKGDKKQEAMSINLCNDLNEALSNMQDRQTYVTMGSKVMCSKAMAHITQRSAAQECEEDWAEEGGEREAFSYANVQQMAMRRKAKAWFSK